MITSETKEKVMKILVINCGSSSLKYQLLEMKDESVLCKGIVEKIGMEGSMISYEKTGNPKIKAEIPMKDHKDAIEQVISAILDEKNGVLKSMSEITAVGHRVVHAGEKYASSVLITEDVIKALEDCTELAPLHNPANLYGIEACRKLMPDTPMVGVFDTAFHQTMPAKAYLYAVPYELYEKYGVRRYGFHGTSHRYVSARALEFLGMKAEGTKVVTAHIGNGGSLAAVVDGKCVDTTMGLTPLEGVMMGTRSGDIDGGAVAFIQKKLGPDADGISDLLNKKSGIAGLTGLSSDMRDIENAANAGNERAQIARDSYFYRIKKYVGAYAAAMGGIDVLVFTAGVGENQTPMREDVCRGLEFMGIKIDAEKNAKIRGEEAIISTPDSRVKVVVIPTDEELMIASDTMALISK